MRAFGQVITFAATVVAALIIGFGVPLGWIWIGSQMQSGSGASTVNFSVAMVILFGIIVTYVLLLYLAGIVMALLRPAAGRSGRGQTRAPWMQGHDRHPPRSSAARRWAGSSGSSSSRR